MTNWEILKDYSIVIITNGKIFKRHSQTECHERSKVTCNATLLRPLMLTKNTAVQKHLVPIHIQKLPFYNI